MSVRRRLPAVLHRLERATPGPVRRALKRFAPSLVAGAHDMVLRAAPSEAAEATIADGPLGGRRFVCRLRYEADYIFGTHEPAVTAWMTTHVGPSAVVFDVGAHAGYSTLVAAGLVGRSGRVVAFEPNPRNRALVARNLDLNPDLAARVQVEACAVSDGPGTARFGGDESTGRLDDGGDLVETTSLDAYVARTGHVPSLVKMDIEGGETRAFDGMATLVGAHHPTLIVEIHDARAHERFAALVADHGYDVTIEGSSERAGALAPWSGSRSLYLAR